MNSDGRVNLDSNRTMDDMDNVGIVVGTERVRGVQRNIGKERSRASIFRNYDTMKMCYFLVLINCGSFIKMGECFSVIGDAVAYRHRHRNGNGSTHAVQSNVLLARESCDDDKNDVDMNMEEMEKSEPILYDDFDDTDKNGIIGDEVVGGEVIDDLNWRAEKLRLEEANTRRFRKAGPRFLPYEECRKWVQAWNRWETKQDWECWIDEGEKRNAYIPARPDEYYGRLGKWKGWDHFLGQEEDDDCKA